MSQRITGHRSRKRCLHSLRPTEHGTIGKPPESVHDGQRTNLAQITLYGTGSLNSLTPTILKALSKRFNLVTDSPTMSWSTLGNRPPLQMPGCSKE